MVPFSMASVRCGAPESVPPCKKRVSWQESGAVTMGTGPVNKACSCELFGAEES